MALPGSTIQCDSPSAVPEGFHDSLYALSVCVSVCLSVCVANPVAVELRCNATALIIVALS